MITDTPVVSIPTTHTVTVPTTGRREINAQLALSGSSPTTSTPGANALATSTGGINPRNVKTDNIVAAEKTHEQMVAEFQAVEKERKRQRKLEQERRKAELDKARNADANRRAYEAAKNREEAQQKWREYFEANRTPRKLSEKGRELLLLFEGFEPIPRRILPRESHYTIGFGHHAEGFESMMASNPNPYFTFEGVRYDKNNPMSREVAGRLFAQDLPRFEEAVVRFLEKNKIKLPQHQFDALVVDAYQRGNAHWGKLDHELTSYLLHGDYSCFEMAKKAFDNFHNVEKGVRSRRIMSAEFFTTGEYEDIRGKW